MKSLSLFSLIVGLNLTLYSQNITLPLYEGAQLNFKNGGTPEKSIMEDGILKVSHVQQPNIAVYLPPKDVATGDAVIICPGGGYWILAYNIEGTDIAEYFTSKGITAIVLKYRLPTSCLGASQHIVPLMDAKRAMRMVRYHADDWGIDKHKIGMMGFSAGGHLASTLSTHFDIGISDSNDGIEHESCRPDYTILVYPVISFTKTYAHQGSINALLGSERENIELATRYSNELQVNNETPPAILIHAADDKGVPAANSMDYYKALSNHNIEAELHIFPKGGHGFGMYRLNKGLSVWPELVVNFIKQVGKEN